MSCPENEFGNRIESHGETSTSGRLCYFDMNWKWLFSAGKCRNCPNAYGAKDITYGAYHDCYCCLENHDQLNNVDELKKLCCTGQDLGDTGRFGPGDTRGESRRFCKSNWCSSTNTSECDGSMNDFCALPENSSNENCRKWCSTIPSDAPTGETRYQDSSRFHGCNQNLINYCEKDSNIIDDPFCMSKYSTTSDRHPDWADTVMSKFCQDYYINTLNDIKKDLPFDPLPVQI